MVQGKDDGSRGGEGTTAPSDSPGAPRPDEVALLVADLYEAAGASRRLGELIARREGHTQARWQVLSVLDGSPRTVPEVARRLGQSRQAVQRVVNDLVNEGTIEGVGNPAHRSSPLFGLTAVGRRVLDRLTAEARLVHEDQMAALDPAEVAQVRAFLRRFTTRVREDEARLRVERG